MNSGIGYIAGSGLGCDSRSKQSIEDIQNEKRDLQKSIMSLIRAFETNNQIAISDITYEPTGCSKLQVTIKI